MKRIKFAAINIASSGANEIIAAVSNMCIRITAIFFTVAGDVDVTLKEGSTAISGAMDFGAASEPRGMVATLNKCPLSLKSNTALNIVLSGDVQVSGSVLYYLEKAINIAVD